MTEQEARAIASRATGLYAAGFISADDVDAKIAEAFAHHRASVRAETLREVVTKVAESETPPLTNLAPVALRVAFNDGWRAHTNAVLHSVLPALAHPEGADK